ncbi:MAG: hypothetical protein WBB45_09490 [Cyclobacteriaceae bacterium]
MKAYLVGMMEPGWYRIASDWANRQRFELAVQQSSYTLHREVQPPMIITTRLNLAAETTVTVQSNYREISDSVSCG